MESFKCCATGEKPELSVYRYLGKPATDMRGCENTTTNKY